MFESPIPTSVLSLSLLFSMGSAQACPTGTWASAFPEPPACGASVLEASIQSAGTTTAAPDSSRETFMQVATELSRERADPQFSLRWATNDRRIDSSASAGWGEAFADPGTFGLTYVEPSVRSSLAWRQEAEDILRRESIADLATQSAEAAALTHLPGPFGAAAAVDVLKRQDVERWRQMGSWSVKSGWELDTAPTKDTLFYMKGFYSAAGQKTQAEAKLGWAVLDSSFWGAASQGKVYVGPFAVADGLRRDQISKVGAHITLSEIGAFHITLASGLSEDRLKGRGAFGLIETSWKF